MILLNIFFSWLTLMSLAFCVGILLFRLPPVGLAYGMLDVLPVYTSRVAGLCRLGGLGILLGSVAELLFRTAEMAGGDGQAVLVSVLPAVLFKSHYGIVLLIRIAAVFMVAAGSRLANPEQRSSAGPTVLLALCAIIAWTLSASGHAADTGDFTLQEMSDLLHLLAASVWGGGLLVLAAVILPLLIRQGSIALIAAASAHFSRLAGFAVAVLVVTALYNARIEAGSFESLWKSSYGMTILAKMVLLYFLLLIGAFNRYVGVPLLVRLGGGRLGGAGIEGLLVSRLFNRFHSYISGSLAEVFHRIVTVEALIMAVVFFAAASLKHETPARHLMHLPHVEQTVQADTHYTDKIPRVR